MDTLDLHAELDESADSGDFGWALNGNHSEVVIAG